MKKIISLLVILLLVAGEAGAFSCCCGSSAEASKASLEMESASEDCHGNHEAEKTPQRNSCDSSPCSSACHTGNLSLPLPSQGRTLSKVLVPHSFDSWKSMDGQRDLRRYQEIAASRQEFLQPPGVSLCVPVLPIYILHHSQII